MCGIIGILAKSDATITHPEIRATLTELYRLSESRGKESAGLHVYLPDQRKAWTIKVAHRASQLLKSQEFKNLINGSFRNSFSNHSLRPSSPLALLAHSRLVTNGTAELPRNNQPVQSGAVTMIHNGIVVNVDDLWISYPHLNRKAEVDTEIMAALTANEMQNGAGPAEATVKTFSLIHGAASIAWVHDQARWAILATNTGDLYRFTDAEMGLTVFASERYILDRAMETLKHHTQKSQQHPKIEWLPPGNGVVIGLDDMQVHPFTLGQTDFKSLPTLPLASADSTEQHDLTTAPATAPQILVPDADESLLRYNKDRVSELRRCSRCVLPETFPFIRFDDQGVCNYCHSYRPRYKDLDPVVAKRQFIESLQKYRRTDGKPDALVAFSGGRDSSYGLHLIKKEFGLTPITFTYDWGMVTDLARRNVARICGQLGIQNILVSADIKSKRDNIRKNVSAWLRKPDLGMVPLFMAGDKHFFSVSNQIKRQNNMVLDLWCANPLENTDFKSGFCGVAPDFNKKSPGLSVIWSQSPIGGVLRQKFFIQPSLPEHFDP